MTRFITLTAMTLGIGLVTGNGNVAAETSGVATPTKDRQHESPRWSGPDDNSRSAAVLDEAALDSFILAKMDLYHVPGVAAGIVKDGELAWTGSYGLANIDEVLPVTDSTLFMLASVSKTITGAALMQLAEDGLLDLDDGINAHLPITIVNPHHPDDPITVRSLFTHTSSLDDNWDVMYSTYVLGDTPIPLAQYVADYFLPGGVYYHADANFEFWAPGTRWEYCNHGFVMIGYLVQEITGLPFNQYCDSFYFAPLGMYQTGWFLADIETDNIAMPYAWNGQGYEPYGHFGYADYPAGALRSNVRELSRHLIAHLQGGRFDTVRVLDSNTVAQITTIQYPSLNSSQGLTWFYNQWGSRWVWNHGGGDQGVSTMISFCPDENSGVIVLTNRSAGGATNSIAHQLYEYAGTLGVSFVADTTNGYAPLTVQFTGESYEDITTWTWAFGDGDSAYLQSPSHTYALPGVYDVHLAVVTSDGDTLRRTRRDYIIALADTLVADDQTCDPGEPVAVEIYGRNTVPVRVITMPIEYAGALELTLDSFAVSGCRTEYFEEVIGQHSDPVARRLTLRFTYSHANPTLTMEPGAGPLVRLHFTVPYWDAAGLSAPVRLDGYTSYLPAFHGPLLDYTPATVTGQVAVASCCQHRGNVDGSSASGEPVDVADLTYLVAYLFDAGPLPICPEEGNVNGQPDGGFQITVTDLTYLVAYLFSGGPAPPACP